MSEEKAEGEKKKSQNLAWVSAGSPLSGLLVEVPAVSYFLSRPWATSAARTAVEAVTDWNGTSIPLRASFPTRTLLAHLHRLADPGQPYRYKKKKITIKMEILTLEGKQGERVKQCPSARGWEMLCGITLQRVPFRKSRGASVVHQRHCPYPASSFFMGITSKCLLGLLGAWCKFAGSFPTPINTQSILLYSVLFVLLIWY